LSIPGGLTLLDACYGNGWSCVDVAAEIVKSIRSQYPDADSERLRRKILSNLAVSFVRGLRGQRWEDGMTMGLHSKHFIIDDRSCYVGSQNLYDCDLGEWGVVIDDEETTHRMKKDFWDPLWKGSYRPEDCPADDVMGGLDVDRDGEEHPETYYASEEIQEQIKSFREKTGRGYRQFGREGSVHMPNITSEFYIDDPSELEEVGDNDPFR